MAYDESKPEEYQKRYELFLHYAKAGDYRAQYELGGIFINSSENSKYHDIEKGIEWTRKSALKSGNTEIQFGLGIRLEGARTKLDYSEEKKRSALRKEAFKWLLASAEQGHAYAQSEIAIYYWRGRGMERDYVKAYTWFKLASDRFNAEQIIVKGKDISDKGLISSFMTSIANSDEFSAKDKALALEMAEKWENDHPDAYKLYPYWDCIVNSTN
jgi:TPR repeat protein